MFVRKYQSSTSFEMAAFLPLVAFPLLFSTAAAQAYDPEPRPEGSFSYVQPLNATILGPYGNSPAFLPSRTSQPPPSYQTRTSLTLSQPMQQASGAGKMLLRGPRLL